MDIYQEFAVQMRAARKKQNLSMQDLADKTNLTKNAIFKIETGRTQVLAHNMLSISSALQMYGFLSGILYRITSEGPGQGQL